MPNIQRNVLWDSNTPTRSSPPLLKNDDRNSRHLYSSLILQEGEELKGTDRTNHLEINDIYTSHDKLSVSVTSNEYITSYLFDNSEASVTPNTSNCGDRSITTLKDYDSIESSNMVLRNRTLVSTISKTHTKSIDGNHWACEDSCDDASQGNSCHQLLTDNFSSTTVPNAVASFPYLSSTSASQQGDNFHPRRGRLKIPKPGRQKHDDMFVRKSSLPSMWSRRFFPYRRSCRLVLGDAVLTFMLFLAMLHLSW